MSIYRQDTYTIFMSLTILLLLAGNVFAQEEDLERAAQLELEGKFREAAATLRTALERSATPAERKRLEFELDRLERIQLDYRLTKEKLYESLSRAVKGLTPAEFDRWVNEGKFDSRLIDGVTYYMGSSVSNLFFRHPELATRRINPPDEREFEASTLHAVRSIKHAARESGKPYVLPMRFRNTMTVTLKADAVPAGETVRAWLPIPRASPHQHGFKVLSSSPAIKSLALEDSPIRSAYFEQTVEQNKPTVFKMEYEYTAYGIWFDLKSDRVEAYDLRDPAVRAFTKEGPHVVFTEQIRQLSRDLAGHEPNPLLKARAFYQWITENIKYSYALEYSTIRNISEYCLAKGYGDCGQAALLFITLCRYNGIPARWQSGWLTMPGGKTIHDWTEIYIKPWGWIPVDPYMGVFAMQYFSGPLEQRKEIRDFYFGGLDQYRMTANSDHSQELTPPKRSLRSDNVDFQRGELEYGTTNIYFNKYSYTLEVQAIEQVQ
jgi:transglutaminase-like putative cysteine protease